MGDYEAGEKIMKRLLVLLLTILLLTSLTSCDEHKATVENPSRQIDTLVFIGSQKNAQNDKFYYYYDKDTKVMYVVHEGLYKSGITPLYNENGTLKLYEEVDEENKELE